MNSFYNNNIVLFSRRFPILHDAYKETIAGFSGIDELVIGEAKSGMPTAQEGGLRLHSAYDPIREAQKFFNENEWKNIEAAVFFSFGLGYAPQEFARKFAHKTLILIESDIRYLLAAFTCTDWTAVFSHKNLVLFADAPQQAVVQLLEKTGFDNCRILHNTAQSAHAKTYFNSLTQLLERNKQKNAINEATLQKFGHLWLRNTLRNKNRSAELDGVRRYENTAPHLAACILGAGPGLDEILGHLVKIKNRCILICVDTALKACLKAGCQPHFIVVGDPQYWNLRHLDGLAAPKSILITELAAYPPIFRFHCRETILFSSLYPPGKFIEQYTGSYGTLGAGGSVATTAWDFARFLGCKTIFTAALDLSFPDKKTHFRGATFEERAHTAATRLHTAETGSCHELYSAHSFYAQNYAEQPVLTDKRLSLFAWWFESKCAEFQEQKTFTLSVKGLRIPGIEPLSIQNLLQLPEQTHAINEVCFASFKTDIAAKKQKKDALVKALSDAEQSLTEIRAAAQKALLFCEEGSQLEKRPQSIQTADRISYIVQKLAEIDASILTNRARGIASFVFPSEKQLEKLLAQQQGNSIFEKSAYIYSQLIQSAQTYLKYL